MRRYSRLERQLLHLSVTYKVPLASCSSAKNPSRGGSNDTVTPSSLWRRMGGISLKDAGVEATSCLCSAGDIERGGLAIRTIGGIAELEISIEGACQNKFLFYFILILFSFFETCS